MAANELFCKFHHFGHCKFGSNCRKQHESQTCINFPCMNKDCNMRHPKVCKFFFQYGRCKFAEDCSFLHNTQDSPNQYLEVEIQKLKEEITILKSLIMKVNLSLDTVEEKTIEVEKYKCTECEYVASSKTVLKRHITMKHKKNEMIKQTSTESNEPNLLPVSSLSKPPIPCVGSFEGCTTLLTTYYNEYTAICSTCSIKLDSKLKSSPYPSNLCPCCHKPSSGDLFSFCSECNEELSSDGMLESSWGIWHLDRES